METPITWFPGHMAKARRQIVEALRMVDAVIEVVDARAPISSSNPDLKLLTSGHQRIVVATKADLADRASTEAWLAYYRSQGLGAAAVDLRDSKSRGVLTREVRRLRPKGKSARLKLMVLGTPNVGKSTLINRLAGRSPTRTGARPGVTRGQQWIHMQGGIHLLDTPGMMWPKLDSVEVGLRLAWIGCIGENAYDAEMTAQALARYLAKHHAPLLRHRYGIETDPTADLIEAIARRRGLFASGGVPDTLRAAETLLKEFRTGKLGALTLEHPGDVEEAQRKP